MSKVIVPYGTTVKEIVIQADEKGIVRVNAYSFEVAITKGFRAPTVAKVPMDAREMVLALIKVVQDYSSVLFASMGEGVIKNHGETNKDNNNPGQPG